jgi:hypothetical protein
MVASSCKLLNLGEKNASQNLAQCFCCELLAVIVLPVGLEPGKSGHALYAAG